MTANKLTVACIEWKPRSKNTLRGFVTIEIPALHLRMFDVAIHVHPNGAGWAALPAKPQIEKTASSSSVTARRNTCPSWPSPTEKPPTPSATASSGPCSISAPKPSTRRLCNDAAEAENAV